MTAHFLDRGLAEPLGRTARKAGPALGRFACCVENAQRELIRGVLELGEVGLLPTESLAELVEHLGDAATTAVALADDYAACVGSGSVPILNDSDDAALPVWVDAEMFARVAAEYRAELRRRRA